MENVPMNQAALLCRQIAECEKCGATGEGPLGACSELCWIIDPPGTAAAVAWLAYREEILAAARAAAEAAE